MSEHKERFTGRVKDYERYRLRYPKDVVKILKRRCGFKQEDLVADVGAGTGMLAELFLEHGNSVTAIEPNDDMRIACERMATVWPGIVVKKGTAEATELKDATVDLIAVGRAFHWFDAVKARREFLRILRPAGWVVLLTNSWRRDGSEISQDFESLLLKHGKDYAANRERYEVYRKVDEFFAGGELFRDEIHGEQKLTLDVFLGQTQSFSVTPPPGHERYEGMQRELRKFFARWQVDDVVQVKTSCKMICGHLLASNAGAPPMGKVC